MTARPSDDPSRELRRLDDHRDAWLCLISVIRTAPPVERDAAGRLASMLFTDTERQRAA